MYVLYINIVYVVLYHFCAKCYSYSTKKKGPASKINVKITLQDGAGYMYGLRQTD